MSLVGCALAQDDPVVSVEVGEPTFVVPSDALPVVPQDANNNLAILEAEGSLWFAWRTAPDHFADERTELHVIRSDDDGLTWEHELTVALGTDVREPHLLHVDGAIRLYLAQLGTSAFDFEPAGSWTSVRQGPAQWSELAPVFDATFIPWRSKPHGDHWEVIGYVGGGEIYDPDGDPLQIQWLRTDDGVTFDPVVPGQPVVLEGGGSETDYARLDDGTIIAVVRNESGDEDGFGSKICRAEADAPGDWTCATDRRKYDSPLVFTEAGEVWLVGRRNVTDNGYYDLGHTDASQAALSVRYQLAYWDEPKRCSLWKVDPVELTVEFVLDLPGRGDTCFPDRRARGEGVHEIWNYTSPLEGPEPSWQEGQVAPTSIYRVDLTFSVEG